MIHLDTTFLVDAIRESRRGIDGPARATMDPSSSQEHGYSQLSHLLVAGTTTKHLGQVGVTAGCSGTFNAGFLVDPFGVCARPGFALLRNLLRAASACWRFFQYGDPLGAGFPSGGSLSRLSSARTVLTSLRSARHKSQWTARGLASCLEQLRHVRGPLSGPMSRMSLPGAVALSDARTPVRRTLRIVDPPLWSVTRLRGRM